MKEYPHMIPIVAIHINTDRPKELGEFYRRALGIEPAWSSDDMIGFMIGDVRLEVAKHDQVSGKNADPTRLIFDFVVDDVRADFDRIVALGATVIQQPYEFTEDDMKLVIATLADLDGNYFQLVSIK
jgi:predicted enzyme related to lactoylglutathione lyase